MSLWSLNHLLAFVHTFISVSAFHPDLIDTEAQEKAVSVPKQNSENIVANGISQSALFFTPSLLLNYWRVFPVPVPKLFSLDLGHVPRP